ncbi:MAG: hypothetical protein KBC64_07930 [Simkaniaceae bacterium]|nr:hypothetical protein [Simkaniaceae bacterium]
MATSVTESYSRIFTVSFCRSCPNTSVALGGSPYEISVESRSMAGSLVAGVPKVALEDILSAIRNTGVQEGTCSVKVNLVTREVVFIEAHKWDEHECMAGLDPEAVFRAMIAKTMGLPKN